MDAPSFHTAMESEVEAKDAEAPPLIMEINDEVSEAQMLSSARSDSLILLFLLILLYFSLFWHHSMFSDVMHNTNLVL